MFSKDSAFFALRDAILDGVYPPGSPLPEARISKELGLSRTPIREALVKLEFYGLTTNVSGRGMFVADLDARVVGEVFDVLRALEVAALRKVFDIGLGASVAAHLRELATTQRRLADENQLTPARETGLGFHEQIVNASGNQRLKNFWVVLRVQAEYFSRLQMRSPLGQWLVTSYADDHEGIIAHMESGDEEGAVSLLAEHFERQRQNLLTMVIG